MEYYLPVKNLHMAAVGLSRAAMPAPVVCDCAISVGREEEELFVPGVGIEWPPVTENDRLSRAPILVEDVGSVLGGNRWHSRLLPALRAGT